MLDGPDLIRQNPCKRVQPFPREREREVKQKHPWMDPQLEAHSQVMKAYDGSPWQEPVRALEAKSGPWPATSNEVRSSAISFRDTSSTSLEEDPELRKEHSPADTAVSVLERSLVENPVKPCLHSYSERVRW